MTKKPTPWLALLPLFVVCSFAASGSSAQGGLSIAGTVSARSGSDVEGVVMIACFIDNDTCDDNKSQIAQPQGKGASVAYQVNNLEDEEYLMLAWRDLNANQDLDAGDELGVYQKNNQVTQVRPPANGINMRLGLFNGDLDALLASAEEPAAPPPPPAPVAAPPPPAPQQPGLKPGNNLAFVGTVKALGNGGLKNTFVLATVWENGKYQDSKSKTVAVTANGAFNVAGLEARPYVLFAWRDVNNNDEVDSKDEIGPFRANNKLALATPPLGNVVLQLERGDASLDALVALTTTKPSTTPPPPASPGNTGGAATQGAATQGTATQGTLDCGKKEVFFGDYGCLVSPLESYLGNTKCPVAATFPRLSAESGFYKGYVYDSCNRPMAGVTVHLAQTGYGGIKGTTKTDAKGFYRLESQYVVGAYIYASITARFGSDDFALTVDPQNKTTGREGGIQNMHFHTREGQVWFYPNEFYNYDVPQSPTYEITFEPTKLLDGTTGRKQVFVYNTPTDFPSRVVFKGLKYGAYNVSVVLLTPKGRIKTYLSKGSEKPSERLSVAVVGTDIKTLSVHLAP